MGNDSREEMRRKVQERVEEEKKDLPPEEEIQEGKSTELDTAATRNFFNSDELGDSLLFNHLHRGKFVCNLVSDEWLEFVGPHWEIDYKNASAKAHMEYVAETYITHLLGPLQEEIDKLQAQESRSKEEAAKLKKLYARRKEVKSRITDLRRDRGKNAVLRSCISNFDPLKIHYKQLDQKKWLFPLSNGVYDLKLGRFYEGGRYDDYLTVCAPTLYDPDATCPRWRKFLLEILGSQELVDYLQRILGYALTGLYTEHLFVVLFGPHGRNGKGTFINVLNKTLGSMVGKMNVEMLMAQRFSKGGSGPSPEVMDLRNRHIVWSSETEKGQSFAHGKVKEYTGGEVLKGRGLNDKYLTEFYPSYVLFLLCNDRPKAPPQDNAFWSRCRVVTFPYSFEAKLSEPYHKPVNKFIEQELLDEGSGIVNWIIEGNKLWQQRGEDPPDQVIKDRDKYREHVDDLQDWIAANCHVDFKDADKKNRTSAKELYGNYREYWEAHNSNKAMNQNEFSEQLQAKGFTKIKSGSIKYCFIRLALSGLSEDD